MIYETAVSLRFFGDELQPQELTERLGISPSNAATKGQNIRSRTGTERVSKTGKWLFKCQGQDGEQLEQQAARLLNQMTADYEVWKDISRRFAGDISVGLFLEQSNEGLLLSSELVNELARRGLGLNFDIYSPSEN